MQSACASQPQRAIRAQPKLLGIARDQAAAVIAQVTRQHPPVAVAALDATALGRQPDATGGIVDQQVDRSRRGAIGPGTGDPVAQRAAIGSALAEAAVMPDPQRAVGALQHRREASIWQVVGRGQLAPDPAADRVDGIQAAARADRPQAAGAAQGKALRDGTG